MARSFHRHPESSVPLTSPVPLVAINALHAPRLTGRSLWRPVHVQTQQAAAVFYDGQLSGFDPLTHSICMLSHTALLSTAIQEFSIGPLPQGVIQPRVAVV